MTRRVALPLLLLALAGAAQARARADAWEPPSWPQDAGDAPPEVLEQRAVLADPQASESTVAAAATLLLGRGDLVALRAALAGDSPAPALGVLSALGVVEPQQSDPLLEDVVALAARSRDPALLGRADSTLARQLGARDAGAGARRAQVLGWLQDPACDPGRRAALLRGAGSSGELAYVDVLIEALGGEGAAVARGALRTLTGHDLGAAADAAAWRAFWAEHRNLPREKLLELGLERTRRHFEVALTEAEQKVVTERIANMGTAVERLLKGLSDEYAAVRLEAATRLLAKGNDEKAAANALPVLLRRLGWAANGNGDVGGAANGVAGAPAEPVSEPDLRVRAVLVRALGVFGRPREARPGEPGDSPVQEALQRDVRRALAAELAAPDADVAAAAAAALEQFRNQPEVVVPLLDYVARLPPGAADDRVRALRAVAANAPLGVTGRLQEWAAAGQPPTVRAAAVLALLACDELDVVLESLGQAYSLDPERDVRFALASGLGARLARLAPDDEARRAEVVRVLLLLLNDGEASVRAEAVAALGRSGSSVAVERLAQRAPKEPDATVQDRLVAALGELRQVEGAATIGQLLAARLENRAPLRDAAQAAVALIANGEPGRWLACGQALSAAGAHDVAAYCGGEVVRRFGQAPEHQEAVEQARGLQAVELVLDGAWAQALPLLQALAAGAPSHPPRDELLLHLAVTCEHLEDWPAAAEWRVQRLAALPEGDARRAAEVLPTARALLKAGRTQEAQPLLAAHVEAHAEDNLALFELAALEESLDRLEQAQHLYGRLAERLAADDELRPRVLDARERLARRLAGSPAPPPPSGAQRVDESAGLQAPAAGPAGAGGP